MTIHSTRVMVIIISMKIRSERCLNNLYFDVTAFRGDAKNVSKIEVVRGMK